MSKIFTQPFPYPLMMLTQDGDTALHNASTGGHGDAVEALILGCADMSLRNKV